MQGEELAAHGVRMNGCHDVMALTGEVLSLQCHCTAQGWIRDAAESH